MAVRPPIQRIIRDLGDKDEDISTYAAMNVLRLKEMTSDEVLNLIPALRKATTSRSISVRFFARKALNEVKLQARKYPAIASEMDSDLDECRKATWQDLLLQIRRASVEKRLAILDLLKDVDDPQVAPALLAYTESEKDEFVLAEVVKTLGVLGKDELIPDLEKFLTHKDSRIRSNAAEALEELGGKRIVKTLVPLLEDDDNRVKATVAKIISKHGETNVLHTLAKMLRSIEIWMRESAAYALGFIPHQEAVDLLLEALADANPEVQRKAMAGLANLQAGRAIDILARITSATEPSLTAAAQSAISKIKQSPKEHPYFDAESELAKHPGYLDKARAAQAANASSASAGKSRPAAEPPEESASHGRLRLAIGALRRRRQTADGHKALDALIKTREEVLADLGRKALMLYREGQLDKPFMREFDNEVKKLAYLIEQKEGHRKELRDESLRTTFINFIKDSVYRLSYEKRVDSRITTLTDRLSDTFTELGRRVMGDYSSTDLDSVKLGDLPLKVAKLTRQIDEWRKKLGLESPSSTPPMPTPPAPPPDAGA